MKWKKENKNKLDSGMELGPGGGPIGMDGMSRSPAPSCQGDPRSGV